MPDGRFFLFCETSLSKSFFCKPKSIDQYHSRVPTKIGCFMKVGLVN